MSFTQLNETWSNTYEGILGRNFPLHRVCRDGDIEQLNSLLSTGNVNLYEEDDFYGWTPIHWAAYFGKLQCLMRLLEYGGSCDAPTERLNQTPAHSAAYGGHCHCLKWLLHCGATINRQDYMGEAPIHKAARTGIKECVSLLVCQGARLSVRNNSGSTASQVAAAAGHQECANYIEQAAQLHSQSVESPAIYPAQNVFSHVTPAQVNGRTSPEGQSSTQTHFISTNTYHSHPHTTINGNISSGIHTPVPNGLNLSNNNNENCDMEMGEAYDMAFFTNGVSNGDVLLNSGVSQNLVPLAGKKRGREDFDDGCFKRARSDDHILEAQDRIVSSHVTLANGHSRALNTDNHSFMYGFSHIPLKDCFSDTNGFHDNSMDMEANVDVHTSTPIQEKVNCHGDGMAAIATKVSPSGTWVGRNVNNADREPFNCLKFRDWPVKCIN